MKYNGKSGDFFTDHPLITAFLGGCLIKFLDNAGHKAEKLRYEINERERRKQAFRAQFLKKHPFKCPDFLEEFGEFSFGLKYADINKMPSEELISRWNVARYIKGNM